MQLSSNLLERIIGLTTPEREATPVAPISINALPMMSESGPVEGQEDTYVPPQPTVSNLIAAPKPVMPAGARQLDRRKAVRLSIGDRARICMDRDKQLGIWDTVMLQDISVAGISFLSSNWLAQGEGFEMQLHDRAGAEVHFRCVVRRCERGGFGGVSYLVGATFEKLLKDAGANGATEQGADDGPINVSEDPCRGLFEADADEFDSPEAPVVEEEAVEEGPGAIGRLLGGFSRIGNMFSRPDDFSTSSIGQFKGKPPKKAPKIEE